LDPGQNIPDPQHWWANLALISPSQLNTVKMSSMSRARSGLKQQRLKFTKQTSNTGMLLADYPHKDSDQLMNINIFPMPVFTVPVEEIYSN
jgi:hypothetical protein